MGREDFELNEAPTGKSNDKKGRREAYETEFKLKKHTCTDIICTIIFLIFIAGLVVVSVFAYINGKPEELVLPHDSYGNICGKDKAFEKKKYLLFFDLTECLSFFTSLSCPTKQVCVEKCPTETLYNKIPLHVEKLKKVYNNFLLLLFFALGLIDMITADFSN